MTANHALQIVALILILSFAAWAWRREALTHKS